MKHLFKQQTGNHLFMLIIKRKIEVFGNCCYLAFKAFSTSLPKQVKQRPVSIMKMLTETEACLQGHAAMAPIRTIMP